MSLFPPARLIDFAMARHTIALSIAVLLAFLELAQSKDVMCMMKVYCYGELHCGFVMLYGCCYGSCTVVLFCCMVVYVCNVTFLFVVPSYVRSC